MLYINEQNLYRVIMRSDKPQAEAFQDWVCGEVLPSIRKTGGYIASPIGEDEVLVMAKAIKYADRKMRVQAEQLNEARQTLEAVKDTLEKTCAMLQGEGCAVEATPSSVETAPAYAEAAKPATKPSSGIRLDPDEKYVKVVKRPRYEGPADYWKKDENGNWQESDPYVCPKAMSATRLLKKVRGGRVSISKFNEAMKMGGYLERVDTTSKKGKWGSYCRLTYRGLRWGFNEPHGSHHDAQIYYYVDRFEDLVDYLGRRGFLS